MKKFILLLLFSFLIQDINSQVAWDSIGSGLSVSNGATRIWKTGGRIFASAAQLSTNLLYEFSQGGWSPVITSFAGGQVTDIVYDSVTSKAVILGKFGDLSATTNFANCNGMALWDWPTDSITPLGSGVYFPYAYTYKGMVRDSKLYVLGRFKIIAGDTIDNIMRVDMQTGSYFKVCQGDSNNLIRDIVVFNGDTIVSGSFVWNGVQYPLARITAAGFDFSVSGPFRGFAHSIAGDDDEIIFGGDMMDTVGNLNLIGKYNGNSFMKIAQTNGTVRTMEIFQSALYVGGSFTTITDSLGLTIAVNNIARWNGAWDNVMGGCTDSNSATVTYIYPTQDTLYVSGRFSQAGSIAALNVARLVNPLNTNIQEHLLCRNKLILYPNPTNGHFTISSESDVLRMTDLIEIFDFTGRKVEEFISRFPVVLDVNLPNGQYFLKFKNQTFMFVINK